MQKYYIKGSGTTAYMLAMLLNETTIYVKDNEYVSDVDLSNVITMKLSDLSEQEHAFLLRQASILIKDAKRYLPIVKKKVGFKFGDTIYSEPTNQMIINYLMKQDRMHIIENFQFETSFEAIDLATLIMMFRHKIEVRPESEIPKSNCKIIITNEQFGLQEANTAEYIRLEQNDIDDYSYVYDCNVDSNVKRFSRTNSELLSAEPGCIEVKNYYYPATIYSEFDVRNNVERFYVGRFASKTRIEQIDVLKFCMKLVKENGNEF